jgi:hypothetical protein
MANLTEGGELGVKSEGVTDEAEEGANDESSFGESYELKGDAHQ